MTEGPKVLVVEDDPVQGRLLLAHLGRGARVAGSLAEARALLAEESGYDLVILDRSLPDGDGLALCKELRARPSFQAVKILILTGALAATEEKIEAFEAGADEYLVKPVPMPELEARVRSLLLLKRTEDAVRASERRYRILLESSPDPILILDPGTMHFTFANQAAEGYLGYTREELLGLGHAAIHPESYRFPAEEAAEGRVTILPDVPWLRRDGTTVFADLHAVKVDLDGRAQFLGFFRDVTARKAAEAEVRKLKQAVEQSPATVIITDPQGGIEYVNGTFQALTGYTPEEALGQNPSLLRSGLHPREFYQEMWETLKAGEVWRGEIRNRKKNGDLYWEKAILSPVLGDEGRIVSYLAVKEDITDFKRTEEALRESERRYHDLVENQGEGFGIADLEERFVFANPAAEEIFGVAPGALTGASLTPFLLEGGVDLVKEQSGLRKEGRGSSYELRIRRPDGALRTLLVTATPRLDEAGTIIGTFGAFRDITDRKEMEEALRVAKTVADAANDAKSAFLANMSHEIRTPLNAVLGFLHLLGDSPLEARQRDYVDKAAVSARDLQELITDILDFSKIEAGRVDLERIPFSLRETLDNVAGTLSGKAAEKGLRLIIDLEPGLPCTLLGDPLRLGQVLRNLGSNAVKFTAEGEVRILARGLQTEGGDVRLRFQVVDTGIGISAKELARLFQPFTQADHSTTRRFGGTGLGLAISRRLVELMDGSINVESLPGVGSTFTVDLPFLAFDAPLAAPAPPPSAGALAGAVLLLVEEDAFSRQVATELLERAGATVALALDGAEAVDRVRTGRFDAVLMGLQMPVLNGYEASRRIRAEEQDLPILAITSDALVGVRDRVLAAGMDDCLTKPIDPGLLVRTVAGLIRTGRIQGRPGPQGALDLEAVKAGLAALRRSLEADEAAARQRFLELETLVRGCPLGESLAPIRRPIESYAYGRALDLLRGFTEALEDS